uniref:Uncharacterized protein n=1 Tax=Polytomella parva TaxID=51329 RepID=A0A7S0V2K3_9CHLO
MTPLEIFPHHNHNVHNHNNGNNEGCYNPNRRSTGSGWRFRTNDGSMITAVAFSNVHSTPINNSNSNPMPNRNFNVISHHSGAPSDLEDPLLVAVTATSRLFMWSMRTGRQIQWARENEFALEKLMSKLPGVPQGLSFNPASSPQSRQLIIHSCSGLIHLDLARPLDLTLLMTSRAAAMAAGGHVPRDPFKRRRGAQKPAVDTAGAAGGADLAPRLESRGTNGRIILTTSPCVWLGHAAKDTLLLVEKPWEDVLASLPPPLLKHRYGA